MRADDMKLGLRVLAPVKHNGARTWREGEVRWLSTDRSVAEVRALPSSRSRFMFQAPFAVRTLRAPNDPARGKVVIL